ncbi:hypothetical protein GCK72_020367 [Caenorhabditis remanei]|uniref:Uncharacterized protein n=1 Tax=Caenorhabditis remanei TaxID=31234 RepID=A0A6A5GFB7_CAERE|nr:hypothetical protein GCK72_020367 [Caenorhabditis remanei]KAF1753810.1 hypothetical protein GCK72_020367 [Caenorhabditis remanei]
MQFLASSRISGRKQLSGTVKTEGGEERRSRRVARYSISGKKMIFREVGDVGEVRATVDGASGVVLTSVVDSVVVEVLVEEVVGASVSRVVAGRVVFTETVGVVGDCAVVVVGFPRVPVEIVTFATGASVVSSAGVTSSEDAVTWRVEETGRVVGATVVELVVEVLGFDVGLGDGITQHLDFTFWISVKVALQRSTSSVQCWNIEVDTMTAQYYIFYLFIGVKIFIIFYHWYQYLNDSENVEEEKKINKKKRRIVIFGWTVGQCEYYMSMLNMPNVFPLILVFSFDILLAALLMQFNLYVEPNLEEAKRFEILDGSEDSSTKKEIFENPNNWLQKCKKKKKKID